MFIRFFRYHLFLPLLFLLVVFAKPVFAEERIVTVGAFDFPPVIFQDESGQTTGMFVDLLEEIGRRENIRFKYVFGSWKEGLDRIRSGETDLLTSVAYTDERATYMDYSKTPLLTVWAELYVHESADLKSENVIHWLNGKEVAVMQNDFNAAGFKSLISQLNVSCEYMEFADFKSVLAAISSGETDAGVVSILAATFDAPNYEVRPSGLVFNPFDLYFTVPVGQHADLLKLLDDYLARWREQSGSPYDAAYKRWFHKEVQRVEVTPAWVRWAGWLIIAAIPVFLLFIYLLRQQVKSTSEKFNATTAHFRKAVSEAPIPIMLYAEDGEIISLSRTWTKISGYQEAELNNLEDWVKRAFPEEQDLLMTENLRVFHEQGQSFCGDAVILCQDGSEHIWSLQYQVVGRIPGGSKIAVCMASDETERLQREQQLKKSEERFRLLFEQMISGFALHEIITDTDGKPVDYRFLLVNKSFENLTGLAAEDVVGKTVREVMPDIEPQWLEQYARVALTKEPCEFDAYANAFDKHLMVRAYAPRSGQFATVFTDVTEKRRRESERKVFVEQLEAKNAELERIAYTISHDLKTPLVTVSGFVGQLEVDLNSGNMKQAFADIGYIRGAAVKMKSLITELLEYTRLGYVDEKREAFLLSDLLNEVLEPFQGEIDKFDFKMSCPGADLQLHAVRRRMIELWHNLIDNAIKYRSQDKERRLDIGFEKKRSTTEFHVCDNGVGFDQAYQDKIFKIFEKLDPDIEGTGIGLAIVKRIVTLNGGRVWVERKDQWTCFRFTLPAALQGNQEEVLHE